LVNQPVNLQRRLLTLFALLACFAALCVVGLGSFTRLIDAGLGCPDWPGCYGNLTAPLTAQAQHLAAMTYPQAPYVAYKAWAEMIHRYFAGTLSLLCLNVIVFALLKANRTKLNVMLAISLLLLIMYQIMLGQWTVTLQLMPVIVSQHLLGGYLIFSTLWLVYLTNKNQQTYLAEAVPASFIWAARVAVALLLIQISLGAWTSTNYASLSCADFPLCINGQSFTFHFRQAFQLIVPAGTNYDGGVLPEVVRQTIQMTHRLGALIVSAYLFIFVILTMLRFKSLYFLKSCYAVLALLILQICLGISNVIFKLPLITAVGHTLTAVLLLLSLITLLVKLTTSRAQIS
jgi:cytochrome c oxidase assembly protein subunit 15